MCRRSVSARPRRPQPCCSPPAPPASDWRCPTAASSDLEIQANEILRLRTLLEEMLAEQTGKTVEEISHDIERDKILTAQQAVEYGLVDNVLESLRPEPARV